MTTISNVYHHRRVAESAAKPCYICYKPTTSVLNQADGKDWFYTCPGHLADRGFAIPVVNQQEEEAKRKKKELEEEIEKVKKEYEEKQLKKKGSKKKDDKKDKDKDKDKEKSEDKGDAEDEKERDDKIKSLEQKSEAAVTKVDDGPRIYNLHKNIYQMRMQRMKNAQQAKQAQTRWKDPSEFPSVPTKGV